MKSLKILVICNFLIPLKVVSQLPIIISNTNKEDSTKSIILRPEFSKYDFIISYEATSYWTRYQTTINILANRKNKWYLIRIKKTYKQDTSYHIDYDHPLTISTKKRRISRFKISKVLKIFEKNRIFTLDTDSLTIDYRAIKSSTKDTTKPEIVEALIITDCTNYTLSFKTNSSFRIVNSYCPYTYLEEIPEIIVRQNFVNCFETISLLGRAPQFIRKFKEKRTKKIY
jgi:hypothetical protein